jgi:hypothetical protein
VSNRLGHRQSLRALHSVDTPMPRVGPESPKATPQGSFQRGGNELGPEKLLASAFRRRRSGRLPLMVELLALSWSRKSPTWAQNTSSREVPSEPRVLYSLRTADDRATRRPQNLITQWFQHTTAHSSTVPVRPPLLEAGGGLWPSWVSCPPRRFFWPRISRLGYGSMGRRSGWRVKQENIHCRCSKYRVSLVAHHSRSDWSSYAG